MKVKQGFRSLEFKVTGEPYSGENEVLTELEDDLTSRRRWHQRGYTVKRFLPEGVFVQFHEGLRELFIHYMRKTGLEVPGDFKIKNYHQLVKDDEDIHQKLIAQTRAIPWHLLPIHFTTLEERISEITSIPVECKNPADGDRFFYFRVIRPGETENNPLHRDAWKPENKGAINIHVPITSGPIKSSLILAPGSHLWPECELIRTKDGAVMNGIKCEFPGVIESQRPVKIKRPFTGPNRVMVYSPYLLCGGITNHNRSFTHISLEMRFWRKKFSQ